MKHACQHDADRDLERQERLVREGIAELKEALARDLDLDERLELVERSATR